MASGHQRVPHQQAGHMAAPTSTASPSLNPLPTGSRPHMAIIAPSGLPFGTSGVGSKADIAARMSHAGGTTEVSRERWRVRS